MNFERSDLDKKFHSWERGVYERLAFLGLDSLWVPSYFRIWNCICEVCCGIPSHV